MHSISQILDVVRVNAGNAHPAVHVHIDMMVSQNLHLRGSQATVSKHANLVSDVLPTPLGSQCLQIVHQCLRYGGKNSSNL